MEQAMRIFSLLIISSFISMPVLADADVAQQINKACQRHAVSLVARLKADVIGDIGQAKSAQTLKIANESCQAYFMREFGQGMPATSAQVNNAKAEEAEEKGSWFEEQIIKGGDTVKKPGHERLKRR